MNAKWGFNFLLSISLSLSSCSPSSSASQTAPATEAETPTTPFPGITPSYTPTTLPTLPATPTLAVPAELDACAVIGVNPEPYGCIVTTFAGGELDIGDGGLASEAELAVPTDVLVSEYGYIYIADSLHNRIRIISPEGIIDTLVGTGPYYGDLIGGLLSTETSLRRPSGLTIGPDGLLYFLDNKMGDLGRVEEDGTVTSVLGDGKAPIVTLEQPQEIAFDSTGNLYIADTVHDRVIRLAPDGTVSTVVGTSDAFDPEDSNSLHRPQALAVDSQGRLFIGQNGPMRVYDTSNGVILTLGDERLQGITSLAISAQNEIFYANPSRNEVGKLRILAGRWGAPEITRIAGGTVNAGYSGDGGPAYVAKLNYPFGVALDDQGNLYIADTNNHRIRMVGTDGIIQTIAGEPPALVSRIPSPFNQTTFNTTNGMAFDALGNLFVTDYDLSLIRKIDVSGYVSLIAGNGITAFAGDRGHPLKSSLNAPRAPVIDRAGNLLFIDESSDSQVVRRIYPGEDGVIDGSADEVITTVVGIPGGYDSRNMSPLYDNVPGVLAVLAGPRGMAMDSRGNLIIADTYGHTIVMVAPGEDGIITGERDELMTIVAGTGEDRVSGNGGLAVNASISRPSWVAVDSGDNIYVLTGEERVIRRIDRSTGIITRILNLDSVAMMAFDDSDNLYFSDSSQIYRLDLQTNATVLIAGDCPRCGWLDVYGGFGGDGGDARQAKFGSLWFFAIDNNGDLYLDDSPNGRIRKVTFVRLAENSSP